MDKGDTRNVLFIVTIVNRLVVANGREPGIQNTDAGEYASFHFSEIPDKYPKNIFFCESLKNCTFSCHENLHILRLKIEHHAYMSKPPIIYVQILLHFDHFFNGGFT